MKIFQINFKSIFQIDVMCNFFSSKMKCINLMAKIHVVVCTIVGYHLNSDQYIATITIDHTLKELKMTKIQILNASR